MRLEYNVVVKKPDERLRRAFRSLIPLRRRSRDVGWFPVELAPMSCDLGYKSAENATTRWVPGGINQY